MEDILTKWSCLTYSRTVVPCFMFMFYDVTIRKITRVAREIYKCAWLGIDLEKYLQHRIVCQWN